MPEFHLDPHTSSRSTTYFILRCLYNCSRGHSTCREIRGAAETQSQRFIPTRLIHIPKDFETDGVRLWVADKNKGSVMYTTLSHCWGGNTPITLRNENLLAFQQRIPYDELPKTFQDAIRVSRSFSMEYIWIDSLCIIQDSVADWRQEAVSMRKVYQNSICNIAASDSENSTEGLFHRRNPRLIELTEYKDKITKDSDKVLLATTTDMYPNHVLYSRGWVFQESFLAPFVLDFTKGQVFWRCPTTIASEVFPNGIPAKFRAESYPAVRRADAHDSNEVFLSANAVIPHDLNSRVKSRNRFAEKEIRPLANNYHSLYSFWARVVISYSSMQFTKPSDRIIAISGVVETLKPTFGTYLAGLWSSLLPKELLWKPLKPARPTKPPRAPTWSWLSLECDVSYIDCRFDSKRDHPLVDILDVDTSSYDGPNGEFFLRGRLRLQAPLVSATWSGDWDDPKGVKIETLDGQERWVWGFNIGHGRFTFDVGFDQEPPKEVFAVGIIDTDGEYSKGWSSGLILRAVDRDESVYERIGHFNDWIRDIFEAVERRAFDLV
jgi:hypothetical protein